MGRDGKLFVATRISEEERVALVEWLVRDRTTMSRVLQVAVRAYVDRALPERYMREIAGYQTELARRRLEARMAKKAARAAG